MTPIAFDIETSGLAADDEVVSWAIVCKEHEFVYSQHKIMIDDEVLLSNLYESMKEISRNSILVTFNGENYQGGFDFPTLRTRFMKHGLAWPFKGMLHLDLKPIIEKHWNTSVMPEPSLERLKFKDQIISVAKYLGIDEVNPKATIAEMSKGLHKLRSETQITEAIIATQDIKPIAANSLKGAYEIITGKPAGDMNGAESVKLWTQYKESGDEIILQQIREYNLEDCRKTLELYNICHEYCSPRDMKPEVM